MIAGDAATRDRVTHGRRISLSIVVAVAGLLAASCSDDSGAVAIELAETTSAVVTSTEAPQGFVAPLTAPPPRITTTTAPIPTPVGFPADLELPPGEVGYYTGSPELGFHLNISTDSEFADLINRISEAIDANPVWSIAVRDIGQGFIQGYQGEWAVYTDSEHALTQLTGPFTGVIEVDDRHINVLLDPLTQPEASVEPPLLPGRDELPRPNTGLVQVMYSAGLVRMQYARAADEYVQLVENYRERGWNELGLTSQIAVGELAGWKITIEIPGDGGPIAMDFENLALSYP